MAVNWEVLGGRAAATKMAKCYQINTGVAY